MKPITVWAHSIYTVMETLNLFGTPIILDRRVFDTQSHMESRARYHTNTVSATGQFEAHTDPGSEPAFEPLVEWTRELASKTIFPNARVQSLWCWSGVDYANPPHKHPNVSWAAVYCVQAGQPDTTIPQNGHTVLYSPLASNYWDPGVDHLRTQATWSTQLEQGDLLLFPGYLLHSAHYRGTVPRTIIAMNLEWLADDAHRYS